MLCEVIRFTGLSELDRMVSLSVKTLTRFIRSNFGDHFRLTFWEIVGSLILGFMRLNYARKVVLSNSDHGVMDSRSMYSSRSKELCDT